MTRVKSLDVLRGITIALMIMVNSPGNSHPYLFLDHSEWNGCTLADVIFPFFIVIVGVSSVLALTGLRARELSKEELCIAIFKRGLYLFLMGLFLNAFPYHFDFATIRILGVLQRIAICYVCSALLFLTLGLRGHIVLIIALLIGYCGLISYFPSPDPLTSTDTIVGFVDRFIFSSAHLYTPMFDPEGLLSTLPAIASALLGNVLGMLLLRTMTLRDTSRLKINGFIFIFGLVLCLLGLAWQLVLPFNKPLWSSSYVLWTAGLCYLAFGLCYFLIEIKQWQAWAKPFYIFGRHAMLVYMLHVLGLKIQAMILIDTEIGPLKLRPYITHSLFGQLSPEVAALCYAIGYTLFWLLVLVGFERVKALRTSR